MVRHKKRPQACFSNGPVDAAGAGHTILVPNAELAAALFDAVERRLIEAGTEVWPTPRIRDFGGWLRERYAERQLLEPSLPRVLSDIEERELWRSVISRATPGISFSSLPARREVRGVPGAPCSSMAFRQRRWPSTPPRNRWRC